MYSHHCYFALLLIALIVLSETLLPIQVYLHYGRQCIHKRYDTAMSCANDCELLLKQKRKGSSRLLHALGRLSYSYHYNYAFCFKKIYFYRWLEMHVTIEGCLVADVGGLLWSCLISRFCSNRLSRRTKFWNQANI
jgi:hypothetical protein